MYLPNINNDIYNNDYDEDIKIIDEDNVDPELTQMLNDAQHMYGDNNIDINDEIKFVKLSFDGDLDSDININNIHLWQLSLPNNAQKYAQTSAMGIFNPTQRLLPMEHTNYKQYNINNHNINVMQYYYGNGLWVLLCFIIILFLCLISCWVRKRYKKPVIVPKIEPNIKIVGKFQYNVKMKLGEGRRGHVFVGRFENRRVAIKRIDKISSNKVDNEIDILLKVDHHINIVRYYAKECDNEFYYIALELCLCSLWDIIKYKNNNNNNN
eukprot:466130_1